jgi:hypothetical protein
MHARPIDKHACVCETAAFTYKNSRNSVGAVYNSSGTCGSSIRRPFKAFNNHVYLPGSRSCKNHKIVETLSITRKTKQMTLQHNLARDMHYMPDQIT